MDTIIHIPNFIDNDDSLLTILTNKINWEKVNYYKRHVSHYEGNITEINNIISNIEASFSRKVIAAFLNYYENGNEYAPYHSDKYGNDTCILSLGTSRILRYKNNISNENTDFILNSGDLLYIPDEINNNYKHSLLKRTKINNSRISILFFLSK